MTVSLSIYDKIKRTKLGYAYRARKRIYSLVDKYMLSKEQIDLGESNETSMKEIVDIQMSKWPDRAKELNDRIDWLSSSPLYHGYLDIEFLRTKMIFYYFAYGFSPSEFLAYNLDGITKEERREFISDRESVRYAYSLNDMDSVRLFMDKNLTYERFKEFYKRDAISIRNESDFEKFCEFVKKHPSFVLKNAMESCGRGIELIDIEENRGGVKLLFENLVKQKNVILEERIVQSHRMSLINNSTVNTVRCFTLYTRMGVVIPWCWGKLGRAGYFVDNAAAGGLLAGIDVETGKIIDNSVCDEFGQTYKKHPDSGLNLSEFIYPDWNMMKQLCVEMAKLVPSARWIGWDMAHTENGWVVVEGNSVSEVIGPQSTLKRGIKKEFDVLLKSSDKILRI